MLLFVAAVARAGDPSLTWQTLRTEHFAIHFHDGGEEFARHVAAVAEEAHTRLGDTLGWTTSDNVTHFVCTDFVDGANGFASVLPYDAITLLAFAPEADTDLGRYDDWIRVLVYHEYTHLLHQDQVGPILGAVNAVLGKTYLPNAAMPGWFTEGLATWVETRFTGGGRVGSAQFEMVLRSAVLGGTLPPLSGFTGAPRVLPGGSWDYIFGSAFLDWIVRTRGNAALLEYVRLYGRQVIPYGTNTIAREAFGKDWTALYAQWRADLERDVAALAAAERAKGLVTGRRLTKSGEVHHAPAFAPSGRRLVWQESNGYEATWVMMGSFEPGAAPPEKLYRCDGGCERVLWQPGGEALLATGGRDVGAHRFFRDFLRFDLVRRPREPERLTTGLRAREPAVRADGKKVAYVAASWGRTALMELDLQSREVTPLVPFDRGMQLNQPRYLPDGRLVFSGQELGGVRDLWLRAADRSLERLTHSSEREMSAAVSPDGSIVYFSSDRGGIWNLHALDLATREQRQVTRVLGGAFNPTVSADGRMLVYNAYDARGHDLYALGLEPARQTPEPLATPGDVPARYVPEPVAATLSPYHAWRSAWPRSWAPVFRFAPDGLGQAGITLTGNDAVGLHGWSLAGNYDVPADTLSVIGSYRYSGWRPSIALTAARFVGQNLRYVADQLTFFHEENLYADLGIAVGLPDVRFPFDLTANLTYQRFFDPDPPRRILHDPGEDTPFVPRDGQHVSVSFGWSFSNVESYAYSISPEWGDHAGMRFSLRPRLFGNEGDSWTLTWFNDLYLPVPGLGANVLALKLQGGVAGGDAGARGGFSVGGLPEQDIVLDILNESGIFGSFLRGYPPGAFAGSVYHQLTAEYRLPLLGLYRAPGTLPLWLEQLAGHVFSDMALVWDEGLDSDAFKVSVGAELELRTEWFYAIPMTFRLGYARGLAPYVSEQLYLILGSNL